MILDSVDGLLLIQAWPYMHLPTWSARPGSP